MFIFTVFYNVIFYYIISSFIVIITITNVRIYFTVWLACMRTSTMRQR